MAKKKAKKQTKVPTYANSVFAAASVWQTLCENCQWYIANPYYAEHNEWCLTLPRKTIKQIQDGKLSSREAMELFFSWKLKKACGNAQGEWEPEAPLDWRDHG